MPDVSAMYALVHDGETDSDRFIDELRNAFRANFADFLAECERDALCDAQVGSLFQPKPGEVRREFMDWLLAQENTR